jgi:serine/threonine-protein kinase
LNRLQRAIIQGVLDGLTYQEIKNNYAIARNYEICYLARYVAYHLWKLLTEVLKDAGIIDPDERVRNKNLWESAMRVAQQSVQSESVQKSQPPVPPDPMLDRKLRMRYRITEHLVSTEFSDTYLAEDEDVPDRPLCSQTFEKSVEGNNQVVRAGSASIAQIGQARSHTGTVSSLSGRAIFLFDS